MGVPKHDIDFFENQSIIALQGFATPRWAKTTNHKLPIFMYNSIVEYKLISGNFESKSVSIGDKFKVMARFCPFVRVDENILVGFEKPKPVVFKGYDDGTVSVVSGISAWLKIHSAKMAIEPRERLNFEITTIFECVNLYPFNIYTIVEQPVCKQFKF